MENHGLHEESMNEMLSPQIELPDDNYSRTNFGITNWTLGFARKSSNYGAIYMHGGNNWGYTASFLLNKENKFGYVFFTNSNQCNELSKKVMNFLVQ